MAFAILGNPKPAFFDSSGAPLAGGTLSVLDPADDTNKASYATYDEAEVPENPNSNPITLDSRGECDLWGLDGEDYKLVLKDVNGDTLWTTDDVFLPSAFKGKDVTAFGATGDGVTDDTTAVQAAMTAATDDTVYFPAGTYLISSDITMASGSTIDGVGEILLSGTAELVVVSDCTIKNVKIKLDSSHRGDWLDVASRSNVKIDGIFYDGNRAAIGALTDTADKSRAHFNTSTNWEVVNSRFTGSNGTILRIEDCDHFVVDGNLFDDSPGLTANGGNTTQTNGGVYTQRCDNFVISDNQFDFIDDNAIALIGPRYATISGNSCIDCRLLAAVHDDAGQTCEKVCITGNSAIGCERGLLLGWYANAVGYPCQDVTVTGNYFHSGATDVATAWDKNYGLQFFYTTTDCVFSGNIVESRLSAVSADSSESANLPADSVTNCVFSGNRFTCAIDDDTYPNCVFMEDGGSGNLFMGNYLTTKGTTPSGTIRMLLTGDDDYFTGNYVVAHSGYEESLFKAGSVIVNNVFDTQGVVAGNAAITIANNEFINSAIIDETGTAAVITGNRGGTTVENQYVVDNRKVACASGTPEAAKTAFIGSLFMRKDGGVGTSLYVKESGTGNTGWVMAATSDGTTGGAASAGAGNQYVELNINGNTYKVLHDGTV